MVVLPDNDDVGVRHAVLVAQALQGVAASVRVLALPRLPPKADVTDWLEAGGTVDRLHRLVAQREQERLARRRAYARAGVRLRAL